MMLAYLIKKVRMRILPNLRYLPESRLRICECCLKLTLFLSLSEGEEFKVCLRCRANLRYEMLAQLIRQYGSRLSDMNVVELDPHSPLRPILSKAKEYVRTYYSSIDTLGSARPDGTRCEDITRLTFADNSVDLIVSSDVLEHVPDLVAAFKETSRVLRLGGIHLFTVPPRDRTQRRAEFIAGKLKHSAEPEYHSDPLNIAGILTFWDIGPDASQYFSLPDLELSIVRGPEGKDRRVVWMAEKKSVIVPDRKEN